MTTEHDEQRLRLETLLNDGLIRKQTMHSRTASDIAQENQGRFAKGTTIIGSEPTVQYPAGPNWSPDPTGVEPPLGFSVNEPVVTGEPFEIKASLQSHSADDAPGSVGECDRSALPALSDDPRTGLGAEDGDAFASSADAGAPDPVAAAGVLPPRTTGSNFKLRKW